MSVEGVEIVPCEACGGDGGTHTPEYLAPSLVLISEKAFKVQCRRCGGHGPYGSDPASAAEAWKRMWRRPPGEATKQLIDELLTGDPDHDFLPVDRRLIESAAAECGIEVAE